MGSSEFPRKPSGVAVPASEGLRSPSVASLLGKRDCGHGHQSPGEGGEYCCVPGNTQDGGTRKGRGNGHSEASAWSCEPGFWSLSEEPRKQHGLDSQNRPTWTRGRILEERGEREKEGEKGGGREGRGRRRRG